jgi:hypothetical protein
MLLVACATAENNSLGGIDSGEGPVLDATTPHGDGQTSQARDSGVDARGNRDTGSGATNDAFASPDGSSTHDSGTPPPTDAGPLPDAGVTHHDSGGLPQVAIVYGQSGTVLYALNPTTDAVKAVGLFIGCDSDVIDIALDKDSHMYATTFGGVYTINTSNAACTLIASGTTYPNSLSFVPAGTLDPTEEALVGYQGSSYVQIDTTSGAITNVGSLGDTYTSSGDIVSVIGGGTYLTVTGGTDCTASDCLVEVNPATGALITNYGSVQHSAVYGLAFWAGNVYGFDSGGDLFRVGFPDAGGLAITKIPIPNAPIGLSFNGAGSTTAAPSR